ncbi:MAG: hypothetical protein SGI97_06015 [candidate division Zixibacteria bacterium]|nr:hypothetical protein [candidate division Zixibacteria bacterium]
MNNIFRLRLSLGLSFFCLISLIASGCSKRLEGDKIDNEQPIVWFVNVPAENTTFSTNPIIHWVGQDRDGQIQYYRYAVIREDSIANRLNLPLPLSLLQVDNFSRDVLPAYIDTIWKYLDVNPQAGDPKTSNIIPMSAELTNPVTTKVPQFVFIQAFDDELMGSQIAFRRFLRIDNPPNTFVTNFNRADPATFIDSKFPFGITGVKMSWRGTDVLDYPADPPPFEFEWRLYGPYNYSDSLADTSRDRAFDRIMKKYVQKVFVTTDAKVYRFRQTPPAYFDICDTFPDSISCQRIFIDAITGNTAFGIIDTLLLVDDTGFINAGYNKIAASSFDGIDPWVSDTRDSIYNVFESDPSDVTRDARFIFWVRCRDDALVPDLTPAFVHFTAVEAKYERDIGIVDMQKASTDNGIINHNSIDSLKFVRNYWSSTIRQWNLDSNPGASAVEFDSLKDYIRPNTAQGFTITLKQLLSYKVLILYSDDSKSSQLTANIVKNFLPQALQAGVNVWIMGRSLLEGSSSGPVGLPPKSLVPIICDLKFPNYSFYFGAISMVFTGWDYWARNTPIGTANVRIEDFVGAYSLNPNKWPDLKVDTLKLENRYKWSKAPGSFPLFRRPNGPDSGKMIVGALPEVGWTVRDFRTEISHLYKSKYGASHILPYPEYVFDGTPVAFRLDRGFFRTAHWNFTPYSLETDSSQKVVGEMLTWLYAPKAQASPDDFTSGQYSTSAKYPVSADEMRQRYWKLYDDKSKNAEDVTYGVPIK